MRNQQQHKLANERMALMLVNEGKAMGAEILAVIKANPVLSLFPELFHLAGHPLCIRAACRFVGEGLHRWAQSN